MPYVPANVPTEIDPAFLAEEHQRIANAFNVQEAIGMLGFNPANAPFPVQTITLAGGQIVLENFDLVGPPVSLSDGPILTDPRIHPDNEMEIFEDGIYLVNFYVAFTHPLGTEIIFEVFRNGTGTFIGVIIDASQQTSASTASATGILVVSDGGVLDIRVSTPEVSEDIQITSGTLTAFKLRDLRTRFS